ncbi:regulatory protein GemA [Paenibacillus hamazuiensis]|uniref:regulatory protein GemA n=1 Tax=Paenibacillus hamazuiensis TaxID=2936508 RepID=UPI002010A563|nr:regulatory protein GemA [Paenibacillus hamazuiensis]
MQTGTSIKTPPQLLKKIWALAKEIKMSEEDVRAIAERITGEARLSTLSKAEACLIIDTMNEVAGKTRARPRGRISKAQRWKIAELEKELGWSDEPQHLKNFIKKYYKVDHIDWLTQPKASKLIESLKNMAARKEKA